MRHNPNGMRRKASGGPSSKPGNEYGEASSSSTQVAHTLTACTRCRQVSRKPIHGLSFVLLTLVNSAKQDAIPVYRDAGLASEQTPSANTTTRIKVTMSIEVMWCIYSTGCANWKKSLTESRMKMRPKIRKR